jgi:DNA polymerase-3 subunit epsilon
MLRRLRLALAVLAFGLVLAGSFAVVLLLVLSSVEPAERVAVVAVLRDQASLVFWSWVMVTVLCGLGVAWLWNRYVTLPVQLAADTSVIATVNPSLRLTEHGPASLRQLAAAVNRLAERYQLEQSDVDARIAEAGADLERERNRLAVLMSELSVAVLMCNGDGRILLYNAAARHLLDRPDSGSGTAGAAASSVGLGRSVFAVLDRNLVAYALERVGAGQGSSHPVVAVHADRLLRAQIAPVTEPGRMQAGRDPGFVVTLQDMTLRAASARTRDELIGSLTQSARSALGTIRAAVENVLDYPAMDADQRVRFLEIIREEAMGMGQRLDETGSLTTGLVDDAWLTADLNARDLLDTLARGLEREGFDVTVEDQPEDLWLHVDGFAIQRATADLAVSLRQAQAVTAVGLRIGRTRRLAELDLTWHGSPPDAATLQDWTSHPLVWGGRGTSPTHREVIARHGGEIWSGADASTPSGPGRAYVRMLIPQAEPVVLDVAGQAAGAAASPGPDPLATYDFSLLTPSLTTERWQDRPLEELSFTVFDTETTGLYPAQGDEIISIGAVRIVNRRLLRQEIFDQLVDPRRSVPEASVLIHGIRPELLVGQPTIELVLPAFAAFAEDTVLVGHNVAFDLQFLRNHAEHAGSLLGQPILDTLLLSPAVHPEHEGHSLEEICARLGINVIGRHSALGDALVTGEVLLKLLGLLMDRGIRTLGEAQQASQETYQARVSESLYATG